MVRFGATLAAALLAGATWCQAAPQIRFDTVDFLQPPAGIYLGEIAGVATERNGNILIFQRGNTTGPAYAAAAAQLLEFDANGHYLREIGQHLYA